MAAGVGGTLWQCSYKFNANKKSTSFKLFFASMALADAKIRAIAIADYMKVVMPADCEIRSAVLSNNNTKRDGKLVKAAAGAGTFVSPGVAPPPTAVNRDMDAVLFRLESDDGTVTPKFAPIPDEVVSGDEFVSPIVDVDPAPGVAPAAAGSGADWYANLTLLMKAIVFYSHHVKSGHAPGGDYTYYPWTACFVTRPGGKKGARYIA